MPKSFRLDPGMESRLERAARAEGISESESIRRAVARYCQSVLGDTLDVRLGDVIGVGRSGGGRARRSEEAFGRILRRKHRRAP